MNNILKVDFFAKTISLCMYVGTLYARREIQYMLPVKDITY